uniref:Uncharacterized protein n=1 Tax=Anguilla anguilla TaxID=7936 RepID=A0A0E9XHE5_ANGAN
MPEHTPVKHLDAWRPSSEAPGLPTAYVSNTC